MYTPVFPLWILEKVGVSVSFVFFTISVTGAVGSIANVFIGYATDIIGKRKAIIEAGAILACIRAILFSIFPNVWLIIALSWITQVANGSLIYAILHDKIMDNGYKEEQGAITSAVRTSFSLGFVFGPWLGISMTSLLSFSTFFLIYGAFYFLLFIAVQLLLNDNNNVIHSSEKINRSSTDRTNIILVISTVLMIVFIFTGNIINGSLLTLYLNKTFVHWTISAVLSIGPIFEIVVFPVVGVINDKIGTKTTLLMGAIVGVIYFILLSVTKSWALILLVQIFGTFYTAVIFTSLMIYVQDVFKNRSGFSSTLYFSGISLSIVIGNAMLGSLFLRWGYSQGFLLLAMITSCGVIQITWIMFIPKKRHLKFHPNSQRDPKQF